MANNKQQQDNSGILFKNDNKKTDNHPDRTGQAKIDGRDFWVSAWIKKDRNGDAFLSLAFKPKDAVRTTTKPPPKKPVDDDLEDSIPF